MSILSRAYGRTRGSFNPDQFFDGSVPLVAKGLPILPAVERKAEMRAYFNAYALDEAGEERYLALSETHSIRRLAFLPFGTTSARHHSLSDDTPAAKAI